LISGRQRGRVAVLFMFCALVSLVACSDDKQGATASGGSSTSAATNPPPSGTPLKLSVIAPVDGVGGQPEILTGAESAVAAVNDAGGVKDAAGGANHPLELIECKLHAADDPETVPLKCAQDAIAAGVVADVSKYSFSESATKAFAAAGIPMVGTIGISTEDYVNPHVFPISAGAGASGGAGSALQHAGAKTIAFISADNPGGRYVPTFIKPVLQSESDLVDEIYIPFDPSVDVTPFVAKVTGDNPDGVVIAESTDVLIKLVTSLRQSGYEGKIATAAVGSDAVAKLGSAADGLIVVSSFEAPTTTSNAAIQRYNDEMDREDSSAAKDEFSLNAWLAVHLVADQLAPLPKGDAPSLLAALNAHPTVDLVAAPPFQIGTGTTYTKLPNMPRATVQYQKVDGGKVVRDGDFVDLDTLANH
jgi:ABC-type branched-subunit amino acid transport system substrate-binding protein